MAISPSNCNRRVAAQLAYCSLMTRQNLASKKWTTQEMIGGAMRRQSFLGLKANSYSNYK
ncbi:MAG: hypothetical protein DCE90_17190 [Pseudanabaena sp.]|nr:MAG: hypothetical protein DCE90_17190 [Pseudanabaena sp.]